MLLWSKKNSGSIHVHGHIHERNSYNIQNREEGIFRYDVGVDANDFYPVSVKQIIELCLKACEMLNKNLAEFITLEDLKNELISVYTVG